MAKLQKEKEAAALAKLDIAKAERSKNKIISSAGKGLVTNNLSSKLKSLSQNKEYDANKLMNEESKIMNKLGNNSVPPLNINKQGADAPIPNKLNIQRRKIFIKGKQIGVLDFHKAALN